MQIQASHYLSSQTPKWEEGRQGAQDRMGVDDSCCAEGGADRTRSEMEQAQCRGGSVYGRDRLIYVTMDKRDSSHKYLPTRQC